ncbi:MAG: hypothetical protein ACFCVE_04575 [Phycisphaerae bacterium]
MPPEDEPFPDFDQTSIEQVLRLARRTTPGERIAMAAAMFEAMPPEAIRTTRRLKRQIEDARHAATAAKREPPATPG